MVGGFSGDDLAAELVARSYAVSLEEARIQILIFMTADDGEARS